MDGRQAREGDAADQILGIVWEELELLSDGKILKLAGVCG